MKTQVHLLPVFTKLFPLKKKIISAKGTTNKFKVVLKRSLNNVHDLEKFITNYNNLNNA